MRLSVLFVALVSASLLAFSAQAQPTTSHEFPYQGRLDLGGVAVSGAFHFQFELYTSDELGDCGVPAQITGYCVWAEEVAAQVASGAFSVVLGETIPIGDEIWLDNVEVFLGIRVAAPGDDYTSLTGRQRILAVPMAARADTAKDYHVTGALVVDGSATITGGMTADGGTTLNDSATVNQGLTVNGGLVVNGPPFSLTAAGDATVHDLTVTGSLNGRILGGGWVRCYAANPVFSASCLNWGGAGCNPAPGGGTSCVEGFCPCDTRVVCNQGTRVQIADSLCWTDTWEWGSICLFYLCVDP